MYVNASVPKKRGPVGAPRPKNPTLLLFNTRDVVADPARDDKGVLVTGDLELKPDAVGIAIYATPSTISRGKTIEGEEDAEGIVDTLTFAHPGNSLEVDEFIQNNLGEGFIILSRECGDGLGNRLHGTICNPMKFTLEGQDDNEAVRNTFTFTQPLPSNLLPAHYRGAIPAVAPDPEEGSASGSGSSV